MATSATRRNPSVWRYRDWVIDSLNADKPYDRFVLEQLAGDELPDANAETIIATGFNRLGPWDDEPADPEQDRFDQLDDMVRTTSQAFLGLTLGCARCHNHKFDALTHARLLPHGGRLQSAETAAERPDGSWSMPGTRAGRRERHEASHAVPRGYFLYEPSPKPPVTHLLLRGRAVVSGTGGRGGRSRRAGLRGNRRSRSPTGARAGGGSALPAGSSTSAIRSRPA